MNWIVGDFDHDDILQIIADRYTSSEIMEILDMPSEDAIVILRTEILDNLEAFTHVTQHLGLKG